MLGELTLACLGLCVPSEPASLQATQGCYDYRACGAPSCHPEQPPWFWMPPPTPVPPPPRHKPALSSRTNFRLPLWETSSYPHHCTSFSPSFLTSLILCTRGTLMLSFGMSSMVSCSSFTFWASLKLGERQRHMMAPWAMEPDTPAPWTHD